MKKEVLFTLADQSASIVPIEEGKKSISGWNSFRDNPPTKTDIQGWLSSNRFQGYGVVVNNGLHCIDFDQKNVPLDYTGSVFRDVWMEIPDTLKSRLTVQRTASGGEHIVYRTDVEAQSSTLAKNPLNGKKIVETIGSKGYILLYDDVPSGSWESVQSISVEEHNLLIQKAQEVGGRLFGGAKVEKSTLGFEKNKTTENRRKNQKGINFVSASAAEIERTGIDITADYDDWIKIGYAVSNEAGEAGREHFHKISSVNIDYDATETDTVYNSMLNGGRTCGKATGASLRHLMQKHKVPTPAKEGGIATKTKTAIAHIKSKGLNLNKFMNKVELASGELLREFDFNNIYLDLRKMNLSISKGDVASIINSGEIPSINPLKDWLMDAERYANDDVIEEFLDCLQLKDIDPEMREFLRSMVVKWMLQIPAMILDGVPPRLVLVAIGKTYIGKSEFFRRLLPEKFTKYYAESGLDQDKDSEILMSEHVLVNVDELAGIMRSAKHVERFKSLASAQTFTLRKPFGKINERYQRKAILCGTSNKLDIIMDHDTGNSRIIPLELTNINKEKYNAIDRTALFGSLAVMYKKVGKKYFYLTTEEREILQRKSDDHTVVNTEQELVLKHVEKREKDDRNFKTVTEITDYLMEQSKLPIDPRKVSRELSNLGYKKDRKRVNGSISALSGFYVKLLLLSDYNDLKREINSGR